MPKSKKKPIGSFAEFENIPHPHVADIKRVLRNCAESGKTIDAWTVLRIVGRLKKVHRPDAVHMAESAKIGMEIKRTTGHSKEAREYEKVLTILGD